MNYIGSEFKSWITAKEKIFFSVVTMSAIALVMLLGSILDNTRNQQLQRTDIVTIDSICRKVGNDIISLKKDTIIADNTDIQKLKWKVDSLIIMHNSLQIALSEIEKQTSIRQDDIRQETNNIINKFNGVISWWLLLLGIICGFAPLVLAYLNHKNDSDYIELLNMNYKETISNMQSMKTEIEHKLDKMNTFSKELESKDVERNQCLKFEENKRNQKLENNLNELKLTHTFAYITSFSKDSKFQQSPERFRIFDKLLRDIIKNSLACIDKEDNMKVEDIDWTYWNMASLEGIRLLVPFQKDRGKIRRMNTLIARLQNVQDLYKTKDSSKLEDKRLNDLQNELKVFYKMYYE